MHTQGGKADEYAEWKLSKDEEEKLLDRFRDPLDPLKFLIVTSKLLTGFDAPILQTMYLDKPMRDHNLLQAICRTNRVYPEKTHGLIVDYLGIFDDVANALDFDEKAVQGVITNLDELKKQLPGQVATCLAFFPGVDRTVGGYEGLIAAQEHLPDNETRDSFAAQYSVLSRLWEALSPDPILEPYRTDYTWLTQVYESVKPPSGNGKLLWHALGAKTVELVHENVHLEAVRDDLDTLVMDAGSPRRASRRRRPGEEVQRDRSKAHRPPQPPQGQPDLHSPRRATRKAKRASRAGPPAQPRLPQRATHPRQRRRPGRAAGRPGRRTGKSQSRPY